MDVFQARTIVETLCKGIDPLTGLDIKLGDLCANKTIREALKIVLDNCAIESTDDFYKQLIEESRKRKELEKKRKEAIRNWRKEAALYDNRGKPWTRAEEEKLLLLSKSYSVKQIAVMMGRSPGGIESRLALLMGKKGKYR